MLYFICQRIHKWVSKQFSINDMHHTQMLYVVHYITRSIEGTLKFEPNESMGLLAEPIGGLYKSPDKFIVNKL